jgi:predicted flavoprotein YhiN
MIFGALKDEEIINSWLKKLDELGVEFYPNHQWIGFDNQDLIFKNHENNLIRKKSDATLLALGGASWPHLGSNGKWVDILSSFGVEIAKLEPANCGFIVNWSEFFSQKFAGTPLKSVAVTHKNITHKGEFIITFP